MKKGKSGKARIGVIMGGLSSEREISLLSGAAIVKELKSRGENAVAIDLNGRSVKKIEKAGIDVAFIALHGTGGEDGVIQGILEFLGIPYTGSGVLASAIGMNKVKTKEILAFNKIPTAAWQVMYGREEVAELKIKYPIVFKPVSEGSSVGVYIVKNEKEALKYFSTARKYGPVLAEEFISGKEITVPVFGGRTLPIIEIVAANEFYDYESKYTAGMSNHIIPARITPAESMLAQKTALKVHECVGCRDYSRVDMIVSGGKVCVIEINTLPGMTSLSLFPDAAKKAGIPFYEMIMTLVNCALSRSEK